MCRGLLSLCKEVWQTMQSMGMTAREEEQRFSSMFLSMVRLSPGRISLALGVLFATAGGAPLTGQQPTPRDMFWSASDLVKVSPNPGASPAPNPTPAPPPTPKPNRHPRPHVDPALVVKNGYGGQPHFVPVSDDQMGIRYSLLLRDSAGHYAEVSPKTVFHDGDHLRLSVMANQPGYLYVIEQGSSGNWSPIFPAPGSAAASGGNANQIEQGRIYQVPNGKGSFQFDRNPGQEKLFLVLSRQRISDLDGTISSLGGSTHQAPTDALPRPTNPEPQVLEATNQIPAELVEKMTSRHLTLVQEQQVDDPLSGNRPGEKAVYVVSKVSSTKDIPRVVVSVTLRHE